MASRRANTLLTKTNAILGIFTKLQYTVDRDWKSIREGAQNLDSTATIVSPFQAMFLGGVQATIIAISYQDNSTRVEVAASVSGSAGVLLDVIAACLAMVGSTIPRQHIVIVENHLSEEAIKQASQQQIEDLQKLLTCLPRSMVADDICRRVAGRLPRSMVAHDIRRHVADRRQENASAIAPHANSVVEDIVGPAQGVAHSVGEGMGRRPHALQENTSAIAPHTDSVAPAQGVAHSVGEGMGRRPQARQGNTSTIAPHTDSVGPTQGVTHSVDEGMGRTLRLLLVFMKSQHRDTLMSLTVSFVAIKMMEYISSTAGTILIWGILLFLLSVLCLAISTQPQAIWIVSIVVSGPFVLLVCMVLNLRIGVFGDLKCY
ncbi:hypothetical protein DFH07DRAFT_989276 [Mycena maculata]|uniref:Transmembrane protein n=1 Tax=Mycena maculata TaxID=230809 RepID=A0AAD7I2X0_9AGAR|nr:hypothetical protein DFH07DRAFT_989276 [Mycena maculata]